ncbi:MAG TPA: VanZ family protein [Usitatibacter sp.]|jgi:VanZ family protein|nr:VanZ family protein [Usitatibacter sp.]
MRAPLAVPPAVRALCFVLVAAAAIQLLFLDEPAFAERIVEATWDKAVHATVYGGMAFLLWIGFAGRRAALIWAAVALVGALDETHQIFVPGRDPDLHDFYADGLGAAAVLIFLQAVVSPRPVPDPARLYSGD